MDRVIRNVRFNTVMILEAKVEYKYLVYFWNTMQSSMVKVLCIL